MPHGECGTWGVATAGTGHMAVGEKTDIADNDIGDTMTMLNTATPAYEADDAIPRRRWGRVIPPLLLACIISYMDRVNIAFAMPGGMNADLGMNASMAGLAGGIFFFGYLFLQIPGGRRAALGSGKKFIAWSLVSWAVLSALTGLVTQTWELLALRFLLGVAEGGMLPVVLTMVSQWFPDRERGRANAMVIMFVPLAGMITAPLSGFVLAAYDWRHLFFSTALLSILFLGVWLAFADDGPETARWVSPREKAYILDTLRADSVRRDGHRHVRDVVPFGSNRQTASLRAAAARRFRRLPCVVGAEPRDDDVVLCVPDWVRLLPAGGGRRVLGDSAKALQRRGGG